MRYATKTFVEERVVRRAPGEAPGVWAAVRQSESLDAQMTRFMADTRATPVAVSGPTFSPSWLDREMTVRQILIGAILTYTQPEDPPDGTDGAAPFRWPEFTPEPDAAPG